MEYEQGPKYWDINHDELRENYQKITDDLAREKARDFKCAVYIYCFCIFIIIAIGIVVFQIPSDYQSSNREGLKTYKNQNYFK